MVNICPKGSPLAKYNNALIPTMDVNKYNGLDFAIINETLKITIDKTHKILSFLLNLKLLKCMVSSKKNKHHHPSSKT
jgi:hypothetical protein